MKTKYVKLDANAGRNVLAQYLNREGRIRYARICYYSNNNAVTHKPQFTYSKTKDLESENFIKNSRHQSVY